MNFKKFIPFCLTVLALGLASCGDDTTTSSTGEQAHQHTYATEWSKDSTHHWHPCTGTDCGVYKDRAAHHGGEATCTAAAVCEDCGESYGSLKAHTFDQEVADAKYLKAEATHAAKATYFKSCTCGEKGTETFEHGTTVEHTKAESWSKDATNHWKGCTATGCENIKLDSAAHVYDQEVVHADYLKDAATCLADAIYFKSCICGAKGEATFTAANSKLAHDYDLTTYGLKTAEGHAHVCKTEGCNAHDTVVAHSTTEGTCEACGYVSHTHSWQETLTAGTDTHWIKCNSCDEKKPESEVAHTYENQGTTVTQNASCTLPQLTKKTCDCGAEHATETWESAPANGHDATGEWIEDATAGNHYKECAHCEGKAETAAHAYTEEVVDAKYLKSAATCTTAATYYKSCVCGAKGTEATFTSGTPSHQEIYYLTIDVNGATKYIDVIKNGTYINCVFTDAPRTYWTFNSTLNAPVTELEGNLYFLGTSNTNTYTTLQPCKVADASKYFVAQFYTADETITTSVSMNSSYALGIHQTKVSSPDYYYITGYMSTHYFATTKTFNSGKKVKLVQGYSIAQNEHSIICPVCKEVVANSTGTHAGGTANCQVKASCDVCKGYYGSLSTTHTWAQNYSDLADGTHAHKCSIPGCTATDTPVAHTYTSGECVCGSLEGVSLKTEKLALAGSTGSLSNKVITWTGTKVSFTNAQASSGTAIRTSDTDHYRCYSGSEGSINCEGMTTITIKCSSSDYATAFKNAVKTTGVTVVTSSTTVTITVNNGTVDVIELKFAAQSRVQYIEVTYQEK